MKNNLDIMESRKSATEAFLRSMKIREMLSLKDDDAEDCSTSGNVTLCRRRPFHPFLGEGQIRLLNQPDELVYLLLMKKWDDRSYLVVPFSSYSNPATDLELKVDQKLGGYLEVLQLWNVRTLQNETLRKTWLIGMLDDVDISAAKSLWNYSIGGETPPDDVLAKTGVPIFKSDDLRLKYQDEVLSAFAELDAQDLEISEKDEVDDSRFDWIAPKVFSKRFAFERDEEIRLAAAEVLKPISISAKIDTFNGELLIEYTPSDNNLSIRVFNEDGEKCDDLDNWAVLGGNAEILGYITGGSLQVKPDGVFDGRLRFLDAVSGIHNLVVTEDDEY
jgi:hypothetical protein